MTNTSDPLRIIVHAENPQPLAQIIEIECTEVSVACCDTYEALPETIDTFRPDVVFTIRFAGTPGFPRESLLGPNGPKWICVGGSGVDHLDHWDPSQVTVTNSAGVAAGMMAEYVIGGFLHFSLDVPGLQRDRHNKNWRKDRHMVPLSGKTLLIVGLGNTGQAIAARAKAFGMHVIGTRAHPVVMDNIDEVHGAEALPELWSRADHIAVCVPLLDTTRGLIDQAAFAAMKPGVVLADVSRGGVVDGAALVTALQSNKLAGAVLDVFEQEPLPADHDLWSFDNLIISPHCSSVFDGWEELSIRMFCSNIERWRQGTALRNEVRPT